MARALRGARSSTPKRRAAGGGAAAGGWSRDGGARPASRSATAVANRRAERWPRASASKRRSDPLFLRSATGATLALPDGLCERAWLCRNALGGTIVQLGVATRAAPPRDPTRRHRLAYRLELAPG